MQRVGNVIRSKQKSLVECDMSKRRNASSHCVGHIQFYRFQTWRLKQTNMLINIFDKKYPNTEFFLVRIQSECGKIRTRKHAVFGHFSRSVGFTER